MMIGTKNKEEMMIEKQKPLFKTVLLSMTQFDIQVVSWRYLKKLERTIVACCL